MSCNRVRLARCGGQLLAAIVALSACGNSFAVGIYEYQYTRSFSLPAATVGQVLMDPLPDGRLLLLNGTTVSVETAPKSGAFSSLGNIPGFVTFGGPSFLAISPDGTRAATGSNGAGSVVVFSTSDPTNAASYVMNDFSGEWLNNQFLAVSSGFGTGKVEILNIATSIATPVIANIVGASAGVARDAAGNLYVGNGFGSDVGVIKAFSAAAWQNALDTSTPLNFGTAGTPIADLLSAYPLGFDSSGNFFVGGGEFFPTLGDAGYAALVDAAAIVDALTNPQASPPITSASSAPVLRKFTVPDGQSPNWNFNHATGELYLNYAFDNGPVQVYAIPEPGSLLLAGLAGTLLLVRRGRGCSYRKTGVLDA